MNLNQEDRAFGDYFRLSPSSPSGVRAPYVATLANLEGAFTNPTAGWPGRNYLFPHGGPLRSPPNSLALPPFERAPPQRVFESTTRPPKSWKRVEPSGRIQRAFGFSMAWVGWLPRRLGRLRSLGGA